MPITHIRIENFKSIKRCDMDFNNLTMLIGANGSGKTNVLEAIKYFFDNLTEDKVRSDIFDANNKFSNQIKITLTFDLSNFVMISKNQTNDYEDVFDDQIEKSKYGDYFKSIISLVSTEKEKKFTLQLSQIKGRGIMWSETYEKRIIIKSLFPLFYIDTRNLDINEWSKVWNVLGELAKVSNAERELIQKQVRNIIDYDSETSNKIKAISSIFDSSELSVVSLATKDYASMLAKIYFSGDTITQKGKGLRYYSSGTNSVKYIEVLLRSINEITRNKRKEPVILLDEPEISLHPNWQIKIMDYYKGIFTNSDGVQTSQIFAVTHSPFIIHNENRKNDKVIVLARDENGKIVVKDKPEYFKCDSMAVVKDAFSIQGFLSDKSFVYLEGRTDEKYFKKAIEVFDFSDLPFEFKWIGSLDEKGQEINTGKDALNKAIPFLVSQNTTCKNICLYDCDANKQQKEQGKVIALSIPKFNNDKGIHIGIENALVFGEIDIEPYKKQHVEVDGYGIEKRIPDFQKMACCEYLCSLEKERLQRVFANLKTVIEMLIALFKE